MPQEETVVRQTVPYGLATAVAVPPAEAIARARAALAEEGFGVLCEIDVAATLAQKLGLSFRPYVILGACNPTFAHQALEVEPDLGLLLPCNVIVYAGEERDTSVVAALDPEAALAVTGNPRLEPIAREVKQRLTRVLERVAAGT